MKPEASNSDYQYERSTAEFARSSAMVYDLNGHCLAHIRREQLHLVVRIKEGVDQRDDVHDDDGTVVRPFSHRRVGDVSLLLLAGVDGPADHLRVFLGVHDIAGGTGGTAERPERLVLEPRAAPLPAVCPAHGR